MREASRSIPVPGGAGCAIRVRARLCRGGSPTPDDLVLDCAEGHFRSLASQYTLPAVDTSRGVSMRLPPMQVLGLIEDEVSRLRDLGGHKEPELAHLATSAAQADRPMHGVAMEFAQYLAWAPQIAASAVPQDGPLRSPLVELPHHPVPEGAAAIVPALVGTALRNVRRSSISHLLKGSLKPLRQAIARTTPDHDPDGWAAYQVILGCALRLRSRKMHGHRRSEALLEAIRAFEAAFETYAMHAVVRAAPARSVQSPLRSPCVSKADGAHLITRAISTRGGNTDLLEQAIKALREARAVTADVRSWDWVSSTNNLACALTLLAGRAAPAASRALLDEAVDVLHERLRAHASGRLHGSIGSTLANLAEALVSIAARDTPAERVRNLERALKVSAAALAAVAPESYVWLVQLEHTRLL